MVWCVSCVSWADLIWDWDLRLGLGLGLGFSKFEIRRWWIFLKPSIIHHHQKGVPVGNCDTFAVETMMPNVQNISLIHHGHHLWVGLIFLFSQQQTGQPARTTPLIMALASTSTIKVLTRISIDHLRPLSLWRIWSALLTHSALWGKSDCFGTHYL